VLHKNRVVISLAIVPRYQLPRRLKNARRTLPKESCFHK